MTAAAGYGVRDVCQRWRDGRHTWRHLHDGGFDHTLYDCAVLDHGAAAAYIRCHHYAHSFPSATLAFGMWRDDLLVGVAVLGVPMHPAVLARPFPGLRPYVESLELSRFIIDPEVAANGESWFLAQIFHHLRRATPVRGVLAFSDPHPRTLLDGTVIKPGHWGTIYQATSTRGGGPVRYLGRGRARWLTLLSDGTVLTDRSQAKLMCGDRGWRGVCERLVDLGATPPAGLGCPDRLWLPTALRETGARTEHHPGNHRYAFPLGRRVQVGMTALTYPKARSAA